MYVNSNIFIIPAALAEMAKIKFWIPSLNKDKTAQNEPFTKPLPQKQQVANHLFQKLKTWKQKWRNG